MAAQGSGMRTVTVVGANGFVGSAFVRVLEGRSSVEIRRVTRETYRDFTGVSSDVVVDASGNSRKTLSDKNPLEDFNLSVAHRLQTLRDFPAGLCVHISSVDVYDNLSSPETTAESTSVELARQSHYGFHKLLAEEIVQHYAPRWLILRLAGMVGPGLWKNPVFDILHGHPLYIHPDSKYQFMLTDRVAAVAMQLIDANVSEEVFNVCGEGVISPREIAEIAGLPVTLSEEARLSSPRVVDVSVKKLGRMVKLEPTRQCMESFLLGVSSEPDQ
jgi:nucleoside-diphosphate-sugar epimerase